MNHLICKFPNSTHLTTFVPGHPAFTNKITRLLLLWVKGKRYSARDSVFRTLVSGLLSQFVHFMEPYRIGSWIARFCF